MFAAWVAIMVAGGVELVVEQVLLIRPNICPSNCLYEQAAVWCCWLQFGAQEPGSNSDIKSFAKKNYGVTFPLMSKVDVNGQDGE